MQLDPNRDAHGIANLVQDVEFATLDVGRGHGQVIDRGVEVELESIHAGAFQGLGIL